MSNYEQPHASHIFSACLLIVMMVPPANLRSPQNTQSTNECGAWTVQAPELNDGSKIKTEIITDGSGDDCRGAIRFRNATNYVIEMTSSIHNADATWDETNNANEKYYLFPTLDIEFQVYPQDVMSEATITAQGNITLNSYMYDIGLFLLETGFALVPGTSCLVSEKQLAYMALRSSYIIRKTAELSLNGDIVGSRDELLQIIDEFYNRADSYAKDVGADCAVDIFADILEKPAYIAKIGIAFLTWLPVVIFDYADLTIHGTASMMVSINYLPNPASTIPEIVFVSERDGNPEIYTMNSVGENIKRLTNDPSSDISPVWSPDNLQIAFYSNRGGRFILYIMNSDGTGQRPLNKVFQSEINARLPAYKWAPDSRRIVFLDSNNIYILDTVDESIVFQKKVTANGIIRDVTWSPDGNRIAVAFTFDNNSFVSIINMERNSIDQITETSEFIQIISWSPDNNRIAYSASCPMGGGDMICGSAIFVMNPDGQGLKKITDGEIPHWIRGWTPDGNYILFDAPSSAYLVSQDGLTQLHIVDEANSPERRVTTAYVDPALSANGQKIVFPSLRDGQWEIYVVNIDGTELMNLTKNPSNDYDPDW